jgi:hypothetical protein
VTNVWLGAIPYFPMRELECPCCGSVMLNREFAAKLPALRVEWGRPLTPNSACRCANHNRSLNGGRGGHPNSLHLIKNPKHPLEGSAAIDIQWRHWSTEDKLRFARMAHRHGFSVGLHDGFCHLDLRTVAGLRQLVFLYGGAWASPFTPDEVIT